MLARIYCNILPYNVNVLYCMRCAPLRVVLYCMRCALLRAVLYCMRCALLRAVLYCMRCAPLRAVLYSMRCALPQVFDFRFQKQGCSRYAAMRL